MEYFISIAGVRFHIHTNHLTMPVAAIHHSAYRHFFTGILCKDIIDHIDIHLTDKEAPDVHGLIKEFDSNNSWVLYSSGNDYYIVCKFGNHELPVWLAHIHGNNRVVIYCSQEIIHKTQNQLKFNILSYPLDQILLMNYLADHQGVIIHSAGWTNNRNGFIFAGKSGAGKSTISSLFQRRHQGLILSDDRIVIRRKGESFFMYGTPWPGDGGFAENQSTPLNGLFFLKKGDSNTIVSIKSADALSGLLPVMSVPWYDRDKVTEMMAFTELLLAHIPMYQLTFRADDSVFEVLEEVIGVSPSQ